MTVFTNLYGKLIAPDGKEYQLSNVTLEITRTPKEIKNKDGITEYQPWVDQVFDFSGKGNDREP
jgi:hypothetical protein